MKLIFASFQEINKKNIPFGMVRILLPILKYIDFDQYYVSYVNDNYDSKITKVHRFAIFFIKSIRYIFDKLKIHKGIIRYSQELVYDYFLLKKINEPIILFSTGYVPKSAKRNKELGGINILFAGNPYDRFINDILVEEKKKFNLSFNDAYTYNKRLMFIDKYLNNVDHIITQTKITYESYEKYTKYKNKLSYINTHIFPSKDLTYKTIQNKDNIVFSYIAHTVWLKGLIYLIQAWNKLDNYNSIELHIAGQIDFNVLNEIQKYKNTNVKFIGSVSGKELGTFFNNSDVCIIPSLVDNHPATISEALYCGLPVITTEGCGAKTLINNGENGFILPICDSDAIVEKIRWFIINKDQISIMGENANKSIVNIENSDQNKFVAEHISNIIERLSK